MRRLILTAALAIGLTLSVSAEAAIPQPVYFWASVVAVIKAPGQPSAIPELIRPSAILLAEDGSADVEHLRWTDWGSSVAHATGISSASNGIPNMAQGKRMKKPAQVTLSNPGLFQGHEVYRCFTLTLPPAATSGPSCLTDQRGYWSLTGTSSAGAAPQPTAASAATSASFYSPSRNLSCEIDGGGSGVPAQVYCQSWNPPSSVHLGLDGKLVICSGTGAATRCLGNPGENTRTLAYGKQLSVGRFRCSSEQTGVTCTVIASGQGFLLSSAGITAVGHAGVTPVSPSGQGLAPKKEAVVFSPLAYGLSCNMTDDGSGSGSWVYCWIGGSPDPTQHVKLGLDGQFSLTATTPIPPGSGAVRPPTAGR